jgi:hypothetical protein
MRRMKFIQVPVDAVFTDEQIAIYAAAGMPTYRSCVELFRFTSGVTVTELSCGFNRLTLCDPVISYRWESRVSRSKHQRRCDAHVGLQRLKRRPLFHRAADGQLAGHSADRWSRRPSSRRTRKSDCSLRVPFNRFRTRSDGPHCSATAAMTDDPSMFAAA